MSLVNPFALGEVFNLLERIELLDRVDFSRFDPDDGVDVEVIARRYVGPAVEHYTADGRERLRLSIAYYTTDGRAPLQWMKDRCQELTLPDADSWERFFDRIGAHLFGPDYNAGLDFGDVTERPDERGPRP